jgi:hypothetical protein
MGGASKAELNLRRNNMDTAESHFFTDSRLRTQFRVGRLRFDDLFAVC